MVLIPEMPAVGRGFISRLEKYTFDNPAWTIPKDKSSRRVSIVSSAAISKIPPPLNISPVVKGLE